MKRVFTDADIYEDEWYQDLSKDNKLFWDYICRRAEYGIWKPNFKLAGFQLQIKINPEEALKAFNHEKGSPKNRVVVTHDNRWFIPSWISFQYPTLSRECPAHKPLFKFYEGEYGYLFDSYQKGIYTLQEKEIEIEKDMEIEKEEKEIKEEKQKFGEDGLVLLTPSEHKKLVARLGVKRTEEFIGRLNNYIASKGKRYRSHYHTVLNWLGNDGGAEKLSSDSGEMSLVEEAKQELERERKYGRKRF